MSGYETFLAALSVAALAAWIAAYRAGTRMRRERAARAAENLHTLQYLAGDNALATRIARRKWLEAAYAAPAAQQRERSLR